MPYYCYYYDYYRLLHIPVALGEKESRNGGASAFAMHEIFQPSLNSLSQRFPILAAPRGVLLKYQCPSLSHEEDDLFSLGWNPGLNDF